MVNAQTCGFCGRDFMEDEAQPTCAGCPLRGGCQLVRCPHCGYENPVAPRWLTKLRDWFTTPAARAAGYDTAGEWHAGPGEETCH
jgi:hypothetical protein